MLNIGLRIRAARLERGFSQGDLESRTGLLRCYLSRVENGHTEPSIHTLVRIAAALELPLVAFFADSDGPPSEAPALTAPDLSFLNEIRQYAAGLTDLDRTQVLALARKMAASTKEDQD